MIVCYYVVVAVVLSHYTVALNGYKKCLLNNRAGNSYISHIRITHPIIPLHYRPVTLLPFDWLKGYMGAVIMGL